MTWIVLKVTPGILKVLTKSELSLTINLSIRDIGIVKHMLFNNEVSRAPFTNRETSSGRLVNNTGGSIQHFYLMAAKPSG